MHFYPGALHMHTTFSDGTGTSEHLAQAARAAGLRWIIITDHDTLEGRSFEGWHNDVLVLIDHEITPDRNHFLALNLDEVVSASLPPQDFVDAVYDRGGFGIMAHPDEKVLNNFKNIYRWDDWEVNGPRGHPDAPIGIELWNLMSDWGEHLNSFNKELLFFFPRLGLSGPTAATLAWWDRLNMAGRRVFGVGGVDAHAFKSHAPSGEVEVFPYRWMFGTLTNYLLLDERLSDDTTLAAQQVYAALAEGRSYFVNRLDGDCPRLMFCATRGEQQWYTGASVSLSGQPVTIAADAGCAAELHLICNGRILARGLRELRQTVVEPGIYRLEGYRRGRPWLYTNPIRVMP